MPGIGAEVAPPQAIADDDNRVAARRDLVRRQERATELRANAEDLEVVAGDDLSPQRARVLVSAPGRPAPPRSRTGRKTPGRDRAGAGSPGTTGATGAAPSFRRSTTASRLESSTPASGASAMLLSIVKTAAFRPMPSASTPRTVSEKAGFFASDADRVADVARQIAQRLEPARGPDAARRFGRQRDVAEFLQRRVARVLGIDAVGRSFPSRRWRGARGFLP